ncbi:hypothetical protein HYX06_02100 [Candidatus Woesearchaeota archaeon]|nr:hypothetical protein [Candidatus Woesearchaeota archaeon]
MNDIVIHDINPEIRKVRESGYVEISRTPLEERLKQVKLVFEFGRSALSHPNNKPRVQRALNAMKDAIIDNLARPWDFREAYEFGNLYKAMVQPYLPG